MVAKITITVFSFLILFISESTEGQDGTGTSGGDSQNSNYSVSYSIGQVFYTSVSHSEYYVSQGIQHPLIIVTDETSLQSAENESDMYVYPNPSSDEIILNVNSQKYSSLSYFLFDLKGACMLSKEITDNKTSIVLSQFDPGYYMLAICDKTSVCKTFKIIKK